MFDVGRVCMKIAGREAGKLCCIVKKVDANFVIVTGPKEFTRVKRRKCNITHLEPLEEVLKIKAEAPDSEVLAAFKDSQTLKSFNLKVPTAEELKKLKSQREEKEKAKALRQEKAKKEKEALEKKMQEEARKKAEEEKRLKEKKEKEKTKEAGKVSKKAKTTAEEPKKKAEAGKETAKSAAAESELAVETKEQQTAEAQEAGKPAPESPKQ